MVYIVLYVVGAILVVNGLIMAQVITAFSPVAGGAAVPILNVPFSAAGVANLNWIIGGLIVIMALIIATLDLYKAFGETVSSVVASTCLTFAIAYLLLGGALNNMYNPDYIAMAKAAVTGGAKANPFIGFSAFQPLGWYCLPMSIFVFILCLGFFHIIGKKLPKVPQFGILWLVWAVTFFLFFYVFALGNFGALKFTGWFAFFVGVVTCAYPALANFNAGKVGTW